MKNSLLSTKTVIRTKDFEASKNFYTQILELDIAQEYNDGDGSKGLILRVGPEGSSSFLEISEISEDHYYYQKPFGTGVDSDKIDIQIKTEDVQYWGKRLAELWEARGPILRPWGSYYLYLRDPDGLQIIIYQEKA